MERKFVFAVECLTAKRVRYGSFGSGVVFGVTRVRPSGATDDWFSTREAAATFRREFSEHHARAETRIATYMVQGGIHPNVRADEDSKALLSWIHPSEIARR